MVAAIGATTVHVVVAPTGCTTRRSAELPVALQVALVAAVATQAVLAAPMALPATVEIAMAGTRLALTPPPVVQVVASVVAVVVVAS